ncbi:hypothetical protein [Salinibacillus aidingensis]
MFVIDFIIFFLFAVFGWIALMGLSHTEKKWLGGFGGFLAIVFIVVSQIIKFQTDYFTESSFGNAEPVGQWVVPGFIVLGIYLLGLINYRLIKAAVKAKSWQRWGLVVLDIVVTIIYLWAGSVTLFFVGFSYFPFAP